LQRLHDAGHEIVQVRWFDNGWPDAAGYDQGFVNLACRPATVIAWVKNNVASGVPFNVIGSSEGSAAVGWSLAAYGLDSFVGRAALCSGPPMGDIADGCMEVAGYGYVIGAETSLLDQPDGFQGTCGPCCQHLSSWIPHWHDNSVETVPNGDYFYPNTKVAFIVGGRDAITIRNHAHAFYQVLLNNGQPNLSWTLVPTMPHPIQQSQDGLNVLFNVLTQ
jgi:hypothetical protein